MQTWIIGNWKQNPTSVTEADTLTNNLADSVHQLTNLQQGTLMVMPSSLHITSVAHGLQNSDIKVGCQDISAQSATSGAYTGDCSAQQMTQAGAEWTLVGHSERREYQKEGIETLTAKISHALEQGLGVVYCIGETLEQREQGKAIEVLQSQLTVLKMFVDLAHLPRLTDYLDKLIIAYEPVWAIGTGKVPSVDDVTSVNQEIINYISHIDDRLSKTPILYGGSVNPDNASQFAQSPLINGALIGGASLKADKFMQIAEIFFNTKSSA